MAHDHRSERPARRGRQDDSGGDTDGGNKLYYHLTLLAETDEGYRNLIQLSSKAYLEGYYYKPRLDWELLERHAAGVIATTGCLGGHVLQSAAARRRPPAPRPRPPGCRTSSAATTSSSSCRTTAWPTSARTNPQLVELARHIGAPLLATNDSHYTHRDDHEAHDALLCVQTQSMLSDPKRFKFDGQEHYLKSADEMRWLFREHPEACDNTLWIAERADVTIEFGKAPAARLPASPRASAAVDEYLRQLTFDGARARWGSELAADVVQRLDFELSTIATMGYSAYFLIVWDLIAHARDSRGSASVPGAARPPAVRWRTACASPTSTRSATTCCSSASSTRRGCRCPTSTWTSTPATGTR